ncbi:hypothetical protein [Streptomyces sp. bgisy029]
MTIAAVMRTEGTTLTGRVRSTGTSDSTPTSPMRSGTGTPARVVGDDQ